MTSTERLLLTDPALAGVLEELKQREPIFHRPELGTRRQDFTGMITPDFWEVGASGRIYDRQFVLDNLDVRHSRPHEDRWETRDFRCRRLGSRTYLLTYALIEEGWRHTRRTTIWERAEDGWRAVYHQGTLVEAAEHATKEGGA